MREGMYDDEALYGDAPAGADMLVMATYGRRGPEGWDAERIVQGVLRLANCPVLVVRPPANDAPALSLGETYAGALGDLSLAGGQPPPADDIWW